MGQAAIVLYGTDICFFVWNRSVIPDEKGPTTGTGYWY